MILLSQCLCLAVSSNVRDLVQLLVWLLLLVVPVIDPRRRNYPAFLPFLRSLLLLLLLVVALTFAASMWRGLGHPLQVGNVAVLVVGLLFMFIGNSIGRVRPNYFVGIRTPWTLANEEVWRRTHRFAGPVMMVGGLLPVSCCPSGRRPAASFCWSPSWAASWSRWCTRTLSSDRP